MCEVPEGEFFCESTTERGVTEHDRLVEIDGRPLVIHTGAPVTHFRHQVEA
jgi:hypothetical protein